MKRRDLIKRLEAAGYKLIRHGGDHDLYGKGKHKVPVPRSREINELTANEI